MRTSIKGSCLQEVNVKDCKPTQNNPRIINEKSPDFLELVESIRTSGVQVPIAVRPLVGHLEVIYGERRLRACKAAGLERIPAIVYEGLGDAEAFDMTFHENFSREDLTPLEDAKAVEILMDMYSDDVKAVSSKLGMTEQAVRMRIQVQKLSDGWKKAIADPTGVITDLTIGHLELIARLPASMQKELLKLSRTQSWDNPFIERGDKIISVKKLDEYIKKMTRYLSAASFPVAQCEGCVNRSDSEQLLDLWADEAPTDKKKGRPRCLDPKCWDKKTNAALATRIKDLREEHKDLVLLAHNVRWEAEKTLKKKFGEYENDYSWSGCKKKAKGAKLAVVIHGPKKGTTKWVKPYGSSSPSSGAGKKSGSGPKQKTPLKERKKILFRKRWGMTINKIIEEIENYGSAGTQDEGWRELTTRAVIAMAIAFGTDHRRQNCRGQIDWKTYAKFAAAGKPEVAAAVALCELVLPVLADRIREPGIALSRTDDTMIADAKHICELLGIDYKKIFRKVSEEKGFTVPKSWATEEKTAKKKKK